MRMGMTNAIAELTTVLFHITVGQLLQPTGVSVLSIYIYTRGR